MRGDVDSRRLAFTLAEVLITLGIIGVVAAMTLPVLIQNHKKQVVETRLKHSYSLLGQVVQRSQADNGDINEWEFKDLTTKDFTQKYIIPYLKTGDISLSSDPNSNREYQTIKLSNGSEWRLNINHGYSNEGDRDVHSYFVTVKVDVNGSAKPNANGRDQFYFYILPDQNLKGLPLGAGDGAIIKNTIIKAGVHYDGEGFTDTELKTDQYRGCAEKSKDAGAYPLQAFCTGIIIRNGWKVPDDYPIRL